MWNIFRQRDASLRNAISCRNADWNLNQPAERFGEEQDDGLTAETFLRLTLVCKQQAQCQDEHGEES